MQTRFRHTAAVITVTITFVWRRCSHVAVISGGRAHINQSVMRKDSRKCISNYILINGMNSGCLTSNYPTRSWFQARKKQKETLLLQYNKTNCRFYVQKHTTRVFYQDKLQEQWPTRASSIILKGSGEQKPLVDAGLRASSLGRPCSHTRWNLIHSQLFQSDYKDLICQSWFKHYRAWPGLMCDWFADHTGTGKK